MASNGYQYGCGHLDTRPIQSQTHDKYGHSYNRRHGHYDESQVPYQINNTFSHTGYTEECQNRMLQTAHARAHIHKKLKSCISISGCSQFLVRKLNCVVSPNPPFCLKRNG